MIKPEDPELTPEARLEWIRCYLEAKYTHFGKDPADIPEVLVEFNDVEHAILEAVRTNWYKIIYCDARDYQQISKLKFMLGNNNC